MIYVFFLFLFFFFYFYSFLLLRKASRLKATFHLAIFSFLSFSFFFFARLFIFLSPLLSSEFWWHEQNRTFARAFIRKKKKRKATSAGAWALQNEKDARTSASRPIFPVSFQPFTRIELTLSIFFVFSTFLVTFLFKIGFLCFV